MWDAAVETAALIKKLGLAPGPEVDEQKVVLTEKLEGVRDLSAPEGDGSPIPASPLPTDVGAGKVLARPVQQGETPEVTQTADEGEALRILRMGFGAQLSDAVMLGKQSDAGHLNNLRDTYQSKLDKIISGEMSLADVKEIVYGTRDIEIEARPTATPGPTAAPTEGPTLTVEEEHLSVTADEWQKGGVSTLPYNEKLVADYNELYWIEIPEGGLFYLPETSIVSHSGFGNGYSDWTENYQLTGEEGDPIEERLPDAAQYMAPGEIISEEGRKKILEETGKGVMLSTHYNLCGELDVIVAMGLELSEGLEAFALMNLVEWDINNHYNLDNDEKTKEISKGIDILNKPGIGTSFQTLMTFIQVVGGTGIRTDFHTNQADGIGSSEDLIALLGEGDKLIVNVNIDTGDDGRLKAIDETNKDNQAAHWVVVQDIITTNNGSQLVRVYNSYNNREEVYDWDTFADSWEKTKNNTGRNMLIEISETEE